MHDENAEFAVGDVKHELHLLVCAHSVYGVRSGRCAGILACRRIEITQKFGDCVANDLADVGLFDVERIAAEVSEVDVDVAAVDVNRYYILICYFILYLKNNIAVVGFVESEVCTHADSDLIIDVVKHIQTEFQTEIRKEQIEVFFKANLLFLSFELQVKSKFDVERKRIEIFGSRINGAVEIVGHNAVLFAESEIDLRDFQAEIHGIDLEIESKIVLPRKSKIASVGIELDKLVGIDFLSGKHLYKRYDKSFRKVDLHALRVNADITDNSAEHRAEHAHKIDAAVIRRHRCAAVAAVAFAFKQTAEQCADVDIGKSDVEIVAQIEIYRADCVALCVFTRALQTESEDDALHFFRIGHLVYVFDALVVNFDSDIAVRSDVCNIEEACRCIEFVVFKQHGVFVRYVDFDVVFTDENISFAAIIRFGNFAQCNSACNVLFDVHVAFVRSALFVRKKRVFCAVEFVHLDEFGKICQFGCGVFDKYRILSEVNGNVRIEMCVECDTESDFGTCFYRHLIGEKKLSDEGVEFGIAVVEEVCNPLAHRPGLVARFRTDGKRAFEFGKDRRQCDVAVSVEERHVFEHVACVALQIGCHRLSFFVVAHDFNGFYGVAANRDVDGIENRTVRRFDGRADINFRSADRLTCVVVYVNRNSDGFVVVFVFDVCPCDLRPCGEFVCVETEELIDDVRQSLCDLKFQIVGRKRCDNVESKGFFRRLIVCVAFLGGHCVRIRAAVYDNGGIFCEQCENDLIEVNVGFYFVKTEILCVDIKRTAGVVNAEQNFAFFGKFLAGEFDKQFAYVAFRIDLRRTEQIVDDRRQIELTGNAQLIVERHLLVKCERCFGYILFLVSTV